MIGKIVNIFKAPPNQERLVDEKEIADVYKHWRMRMFYSMFIAYVVFYMCRKNITIAMPGMQESLGYSCTELGILGSTLYITYAFGKFFNGILADKGNIRAFLTFGLAVTAVINVCFGLTSSIWLLAFLWGLNGWVQSMGFPPIAKGLSLWFSKKERATKWSIWSTAHQVGTAIAKYLSGFILVYFSWKFVFIIPGLLTLIIAMFIFDRVRDTPKSLGLPTIEEYKNEPIIEKEAEKTIEKETSFQTFYKHILPNKVLWVLAITYVFVYIVRYGTDDWLYFFFLKYKHYSDMQAVSLSGILPVAGILGTVGAGYISDTFFKARRMPLNLISLIIVGIAILFLVVFTKNSYLIDMAIVSVIGIFTYIPQVLVGGVCSVESGSTKVAAAATGFTGMFGYFGAFLSGPVTGILIDSWGWVQTLYFWAIAAFVGALLCMTLLRSEHRRLKEEK